MKFQKRENEFTCDAPGPGCWLLVWLPCDPWEPCLEPVSGGITGFESSFIPPALAAIEVIVVPCWVAIDDPGRTSLDCGWFCIPGVCWAIGWLAAWLEPCFCFGGCVEEFFPTGDGDEGSWGEGDCGVDIPWPTSPELVNPWVEPGWPWVEPGGPCVELGEPFIEPGGPCVEPGCPCVELGEPFIEPGWPCVEPGKPCVEPGITWTEPCVAPGDTCLDFVFGCRGCCWIITLDPPCLWGACPTDAPDWLVADGGPCWGLEPGWLRPCGCPGCAPVCARAWLDGAVWPCPPWGNWLFIMEPGCIAEFIPEFCRPIDSGPPVPVPILIQLAPSDSLPVGWTPSWLKFKILVFRHLIKTSLTAQRFSKINWYFSIFYI